MKIHNFITNIADYRTKMTPFFGFTIGGLMMLTVVIVIAFSAIDSLGFSSEKSISKEVDSALDLEDPQMCLNFDEPLVCVSNMAHLNGKPAMCVSLLDDEKDQYDCLSIFFRTYQEGVCEYVSENYYSDCMIEAQNWKN